MDLLVCERKLRKCTCTVSYTPMVLKYNEEQIAFRNAIKKYSSVYCVFKYYF